MDLLDRQAFTDEPYRKMLRKEEGRERLSTIAAAPMIRIPVPKKKEEAIEIPKYLLKITLRKVKRLAQPSERIILPNIATSREPIFTAVS